MCCLGQPFGMSIQYEPGPLPRRLKLVRHRRYPGDVIRDRKFAASEPCENEHVPGRRKVGAREASTADFQLDTEKCMQDLRIIQLCGNVQRARAGPKRPDLFGVDRRKPIVGIYFIRKVAYSDQVGASYTRIEIARSFACRTNGAHRS